MLDFLKDFVKRKTFYTRGLPLTKKMWRDGYNKALQDTLTALEIHIDNENKTSTIRPNDVINFDRITTLRDPKPKKRKKTQLEGRLKI